MAVNTLKCEVIGNELLPLPSPTLLLWGPEK